MRAAIIVIITFFIVLLSFFNVKLLLLSLSCNYSFDVGSERWFNPISEKSHLLMLVNR